MFSNVVNLLTSRFIGPFRLLLYVEWLLLGLVMLALLVPLPLMPPPQFSVFALLSFIGFGLMGLRLPTNRLSCKILYTVLEFGIILLLLFLYHQNRGIPFLVMIVVIRSCQIFNLPNRLAVSGVAFGVFLLSIIQLPGLQSEREPFPFESVLKLTPSEQLALDSNFLLLKLNFIISYGLTFIAILLLVNSLLSEYESRKNLAIAHEKLHQYALKIENQATLQERNRIAREIHDTLGHALTAQSIQLENALLFCPPNAEKTRTFLTEAKHLCSKALQEVRQSVATLRSDPSPGRSLEAAIALAVKKFHQTTGITPHYTINLSSQLSAEVSTAIHRIIQEALMNVYKHSLATQVAIHLQEKGQEVTLWIEDNGNGFYPEQNATGFGLQGMRERTLALGGEFHLVSQPGTGCLITAHIPLLTLINTQNLEIYSSQ